VVLWLSWLNPWLLFGVLLVALAGMVAMIWLFAKFLRQLLRRFSGSVVAVRNPGA
jgi:uncharacterized membrane protein